MSGTQATFKSNLTIGPNRPRPRLSLLKGRGLLEKEGKEGGCPPATDRSKEEGNRPPSRNMYHPTRGGVRGGRDQFKWDDVKVDKHRENYLGHSVKAPVGRWQKGKDLLWYAKDKKSNSEGALKEEIRRVKEEEEQAMREALGLAPKRSNRPQGNRLDKHEYADLIKRGSTAEDLGAGHAEAAQVQGLGLYKAPRDKGEASSLKLDPPEMTPEQVDAPPAAKQEDSEDDRKGKSRREERRGDKERKREKHADGRERRRDKHDRRHDSEDKQKRRHGSDSD